MSNVLEKERPVIKFKGPKLNDKQLTELRVKVAERQEKSARAQKLLEKDLPFASYEALRKKLKK